MHFDRIDFANGKWSVFNKSTFGVDDVFANEMLFESAASEAIIWCAENAVGGFYPTIHRNSTHTPEFDSANYKVVERELQRSLILQIQFDLKDDALRLKNAFG